MAKSISSTELINNAKQYDGKTVVYEGEVVGDVMVRGEHAWINVHDGKNAIGIWIDKGLTKNISYTGGYQVRGDTVEISGVFSRACRQHGGDLDIHAYKLRRVQRGRETPESMDIGKRNLIFLLSGILCILLILRLSKSR